LQHSKIRPCLTVIQVVSAFVISRPGQWSVTRRSQTIVASVFVSGAQTLWAGLYIIFRSCEVTRCRKRRSWSKALMFGCRGRVAAPGRVHAGQHRRVFRVDGGCLDQRTAVMVRKTEGGYQMASSTGLFNVNGQRRVPPPIRGRADELKV